MNKETKIYTTGNKNELHRGTTNKHQGTKLFVEVIF
jgi:hypothetical protein